MTINYTWRIADAEAYPQLTIDGTTYQNVVHTVHWRLRARDVDTSGNVQTVTWPNGTKHRLEAEVYGSINFDTFDPGADQFIDAADLDSQTLAHWAAVAIDAQEEGDVRSLKDKLAADIEAIRNPISVSLGLTGEVNDSEV